MGRTPGNDNLDSDSSMSPRLKQWLPVHDKQYRQLREKAKLPNPQIAAAMGFSLETLRKHARRLGYSERKRGPQVGATFHPERNASIVRDAQSGMLTDALCEKYGLKAQRINKILRRFLNNGQILENEGDAGRASSSQ